MEPVEQVLGLRVEIARQVTNIFTAVGEKGDLLVGLHALGLEHLKQPAFRLGVVGLHVAETARPALGGNGLASNHLEPAVRREVCALEWT